MTLRHAIAMRRTFIPSRLSRNGPTFESVSASSFTFFFEGGIDMASIFRVNVFE
jgi:hypothetical protein